MARTLAKKSGFTTIHRHQLKLLPDDESRSQLIRINAQLTQFGCQSLRSLRLASGAFGFAVGAFGFVCSTLGSGRNQSATLIAPPQPQGLLAFIGPFPQPQP